MKNSDPFLTAGWALLFSVIAWFMIGTVDALIIVGFLAIVIFLIVEWNNLKPSPENQNGRQKS